MVQDDFVGIWNLVAAEFHWPDGEAADFQGPDAAGMLIYGARGQMSVQIMHPRRPAFASGDGRRGTPAEIKTAFEGYLAYYGTYSVDAAEHSVTHHMRGSLFPNWVGQDLKRYFEFSGDRLILRTPPLGAAGQPFATVLVWERAK